MANVQKLRENLERNGFIVSYYETAAEAKAALVAAIKGKTVGFGGSCTLRDMGLFEALSEENEVFWHWKQQPINEARAKANAAAACEGRMSGVNLPIMSVGGKGNVGVASSMPIISLARDLGKSEEEMLRALTLSTLVAIAVIQRIGKAPTMCSCEVAAALGVSAGATLLMGGDEAKVEIAMQNFIPNVFGVVCDGAKLACALRMATATGAALDAAKLAIKGVRLANNQGVLDVDIDASIDFLGDFALNCMLESDMALNRKMMEKRNIFPLMTFTERQKQ